MLLAVLQNGSKRALCGEDMASLEDELKRHDAEGWLVTKLLHGSKWRVARFDLSHFTEVIYPKERNVSRRTAETASLVVIMAKQTAPPEVIALPPALAAL